VQPSVTDLPAHHLERVSAMLFRGAVTDVTDAQASDGAVWQPRLMRSCNDEARSLRAVNLGEGLLLPWGLSAAGLIVPEESMMGFPRLPLDRAWTGCMEYIPPVREGRAVELAGC
jgi:hypothetical protein